MSAIGLPAVPTMSLSVSRKSTPRRSRHARPTVVLPAPGGPTRTSTGPGHRIVEALEVALAVAAGLLDGVAAELLERGVGQHQRDHRLGDDAGRGHGADVAALVVRDGLLARRRVDRS